MFREISAIAVDDGLQFDVESVRASPIREEARYGGIRIEINATLDRARIKLQVDVGFGDAVTPAAIEVVYPGLLDDLPPPRLRVYPREVVCAEKLEAIVQLGMANTRMKDYFDLLILAREGEIEKKILTRAIAATFHRRGTPIPESLPIGLTSEFAANAQKQTQWSAFLARNRLEAPALLVVATELAQFFSESLSMAHMATDSNEK
jgi:predicted nucleotidyltransferase component of viral defense system